MVVVFTIVDKVTPQPLPPLCSEHWGSAGCSLLESDGHFSVPVFPVFPFPSVSHQGVSAARDAPTLCSEEQNEETSKRKNLWSNHVFWGVDY